MGIFVDIVYKLEILACEISQESFGFGETVRSLTTGAIDSEYPVDLPETDFFGKDSGESVIFVQVDASINKFFRHRNSCICGFETKQVVKPSEEVMFNWSFS